MTTPRKVWRPSASALSRAFACESSVVFERSPDEVERAHDAPSKRGDRLHSAFEKRLLGARIEDVLHSVLPTDHVNIEVALEMAPRLTPLPGLPFAEVEAWFNPETGEAMLGTAGCPRPPGYYRGRSDQIGMYKDMPAVLDLKSGAPSFQPDGACDQIGFFVAWLRAMHYGAPIAGLIYLSKNFKAREHIWDNEQIDAFVLRLWTLEQKLRRIENGEDEPTLAKNKGCKFCPVLPTCSLWKEGKDAIS